jgi:hypothetical protein
MADGTGYGTASALHMMLPNLEVNFLLSYFNIIGNFFKQETAIKVIL